MKQYKVPLTENEKSNSSGEKEIKRKAEEFINVIKNKELKLLIATTTDKDGIDEIDEASELALQEWVDTFKNEVD
jgi:hypothetical protein